MSNLASHDLDVSRLLLDLKLCSDLVGRFAGWLDPVEIATSVTEGLIEKFDCAFARIWLVEEDRHALRLVASSGLYTRLDGSFAQVPMGAFKVGKIAQHCIPFLSNCLPDEDWVKDRAWAIENRIQGFAGLPLMVQEDSIGVLAIFSHKPMAPEFLEVLQMLSLSVTGALASALNHQAQSRPALFEDSDSFSSLSEQISVLLGRQKLSLLGTEQRLAPPVEQLLLKMADRLVNLLCHYCRLVYEENIVILEAMLAVSGAQSSVTHPLFQDIMATAENLGGTFQIQVGADQTIVRVSLQLPQQVSPTVSKPLPMSVPDSPLSEREQQVLQKLAQGFRDRNIAEQLYISERTVKFHTKNILAKLNVRTRIQAVFEATQKGWL